jgi:hypothetical protein
LGFKRYENNPVVFYQHKSNSENPDMLIGTSTIRVENNQLIGVVRFEKLRSILLLKRFGKNTSWNTSHGFNRSKPRAGRWGEERAGEDPEAIYFTDQELLEWSW